MLPDLNQISYRNLASFAAIVGGTAVACTTGGIAGAVGATLASIFINVATADAAAEWDKQRRDPRFSHANHDLTRLIADSIARTLFQLADTQSSPEWFKSIAEIASQKYLAICSHESLAAIRSDRLPDLFEQAASEGTHNIRLLSEPFNVGGKKKTVAFALVDYLRQEAHLQADEEKQTAAEQAIISGLFPSIREMFKRAYEGSERSYAALSLDVDSEILNRLTSLLKGQRRIFERLGLLSELHERSLRNDDLARDVLSRLSDSISQQSRLVRSMLAPSQLQNFISNNNPSALTIEPVSPKKSPKFVERVKESDLVFTKGDNVRLLCDISHNSCVALLVHQDDDWKILDIAEQTQRFASYTAGRVYVPSDRSSFAFTHAGRVQFVLLVVANEIAERLRPIIEACNLIVDVERESTLIDAIQQLPGGKWQFLQAECFVI